MAAPLAAPRDPHLAVTCLPYITHVFVLTPSVCRPCPFPVTVCRWGSGCRPPGTRRRVSPPPVLRRSLWGDRDISPCGAEGDSPLRAQSWWPPESQLSGHVGGPPAGVAAAGHSPALRCSPGPPVSTVSPSVTPPGPSCVPTGPPAPSPRPHRASCRYEAELSPVDQKLSALRSPLAQRPFFEAPSTLGPVDLYEYESGDDLQPS